MRISFFAPIDSCHKECSENLSFLRPATQLFNFGQKSYRITAIQGNKAMLYLEQTNNPKPTWLGIAIRVALIATVIIPLLAIAAIAIYRLANKLQLSCIPEAIQRSLLATKTMNDSQGCGALCNIAEFLVPHDKIRAGQVLNCAIERAKNINLDSKKTSVLVDIAGIMALYDLERAFKIPKLSLDEKGSSQALTKIAISIASVNAIKAEEFANSLSGDNKSLVMRHVAIAKVKTDLEGAISIVNSLTGLNKLLALEAIIKIMAPEDPERALKFANEAVVLAYTLNAIQKNIVIMRLVVAFFVKQDITRSIDFANAMLSKDVPVFSDTNIYAAISKELAKSNPEEALQWVNTLNEGHRLFALGEVAKELSITNPEKAKQITEDLIAAVNLLEEKDRETHLIRCAGIMALFDLDKALEIASSLNDGFYKAEALIKIVKARASTHPQETSKLASFVFKTGTSIKLSDERASDNHSMPHSQACNIFLSLAKALC